MISNLIATLIWSQLGASSPLYQREDLVGFYNTSTPAPTTITKRTQVSPAQGIAGCMLCLAGFAFCFTGKKVFLPSLFLSGLFSLGIVTFTLLDVIQNQWRSFGPATDWIYILTITPVAILGGFLFRRVTQLGVVMIGALHGYVWANLLLFTGLGSAFSKSAHIVFEIACIGVGVSSVFFMEHMALVVGSAFVGGFFVGAGGDLFACTGYVEVLRRGMTAAVPAKGSEIPGEAWGILAAVLVLGIAGWYVQTRGSPPVQQTAWNPGYLIFGANPPSAPPPVWFQMPLGKAADSPPAQVAPFSVGSVLQNISTMIVKAFS
ncbi:hypothetical protein BCR33DRAFT_768560 [Rhizoclosmatium globosum]|uniref:TM7S3/TM198-like domain-containing protein n=1 Tax=Rhizoclosmatium globosum TaxID=329046 RepID=A0A1Y2BXR0_9FUNG|nr:hypothetical protein HDU79_005259 [Rhizoclosmatium sp. JEL0117]ORY39560.1 hypothetical protein BCR33DRAFT_768560 [Rhizoclosmatium globosum]|eukprot:ORY39560.1 hypothetical protein BCR33DRAFT_768560 [Rhizoclosmatium globosum]